MTREDAFITYQKCLLNGPFFSVSVLNIFNIYHECTVHLTLGIHVRYQSDFNCNVHIIYSPACQNLNPGVDTDMEPTGFVRNEVIWFERAGI